MITVGERRAVIVKGDYTPAEMWSGNEKIAGFHDTETIVPSVVAGTYNDTVKITAKGVSFQQTYDETEPQTGKLVQMNWPTGQPLDITANISAKETPPMTNLVTKGIPAIFENTVEKNIKLKAYGRSEQQKFDETESQTGSFVQMELPAGQPLDVIIHIEAERASEGEPSSENVRAIRGYDSVSLTVCGRNIIDKRDSLIVAIREETTFSSWASAAFDCAWVRSHLKPNTTYSIAYDIECVSMPEYDTEFASNAGLLLYSSKKGSIGRVGQAYLRQGQTLTVNDSFTTPADIDDPTLDYHFLAYTNRYLKDGKGVHSSMIIRNLQITVGEDTHNRYLPYIGRSENISLPETSYGGYIDWTRKKYVKTRDMNSKTGVIHELETPIEYDLSAQITEKLAASVNGVTTVFSDQANVTVHGAAVPSFLHSSELTASSGVIQSHGKNAVQGIELPSLRAIPDRTGGWSVRDELVSVPAMPGWYDLTRNVAEYVVKGTEQNIGDLDLYAHADTTNVGITQEKIQQTINDVCVCNIALYNDKNRSPWSTNIPGVTINGIQLHMNILNSITGVTNDMTASEKRAAVNAFLKKRYEDGNPVIFWGKAQTPTTERIYLGELKSSPQYTALDTDGQLMPDVEATVYVSASDGGDKGLENPSTLTGYDTVSITVCSKGILDSNKQTYTVNLPHTCYGGYVDWTKRKYVQTYEKHIVTGDEAWQESMDMYGGIYFLAYNALKHLPVSSGTQICNQIKIGNPYTEDKQNFIWALGSESISQLRIGFAEPSFSTVNEVKTYLKRLYGAGSPVEIIYELTQPIEYDLSEQIDGELCTSKDGVTTVFSDRKSVTVNGAKSPSPVHPREMIPSCGVVKIRGKNLWNPNADFSNAADYPSGNGYYGYRMDLKPNTCYTISANGNKRLNYVIATTTNQQGQHPTTSAWLSHCTNETLSMPNGYVIIRTRDDGRLFINVNGGNTSERFKARMSENFDFMQIEEGISPSEYVPYFEPTQNILPVLRAIPDGNGDWAVRDELTSVPGMPGWYDLKRNVAEVIVTGDRIKKTSPYEWAGTYGLYLQTPEIAPSPSQTSVGLCSHSAVLTGSEMFSHKSTVWVGYAKTNHSYFINYFPMKSGVNEVRSWLTEQEEAGTPLTLWGIAAEPTTERIFLGELKTYPRYTILSWNGQLLLDITATVKISG